MGDRNFKDMTFADFRAIDVTPYCDKREAKDDKGKKIEVLYLNWARCKQILHDLGAKTVYFEPVTGDNGSSLIQSDTVFTDKNGITNRCYEVRVRIVIDDMTFESQFPLMNGANPVKDNSMTQQRLWNAQTRAFVKGVAIRLGLGFDLWLSADEDLPQEETEDLSKHSIMKIRQRVQELVTDKINQGIPFSVIADRLGMDEESVRAKFAVYTELANFERKIWEMKP